jgi:hypothetical protein
MPGTRNALKRWFVSPKNGVMRVRVNGWGCPEIIDRWLTSQARISQGISAAGEKTAGRKDPKTGEKD